MLDKIKLQKNNDSADPSSVTYIDGLGFMPCNNDDCIKKEAARIRRMSNIVSISVCLYFVAQHFLQRPLSYLAYMLGLNISINYSTGLILITDFSKIILDFIVNLLSLILPIILCGTVYHSAIQSSKVFHRPKKGIISIAVPITVAVGILGYAISDGIYNMFSNMGIVFGTFPSSITTLSLTNLVNIGLILILVFFEELLFRGVILTPLRRFGDDFAIITSAILFTLFTSNLSEFPAAFFLGLILGYFTIRSGSIVTPVISRICFVAFCYIIRITSGLLEPSLALVINLLLVAIILIVAILSFIHFTRNDSNAFKLIKNNMSIAISSRIGLFCTSFVFLVFTVFIIIRIATSMQVIG